MRKRPCPAPPRGAAARAQCPWATSSGCAAPDTERRRRIRRLQQDQFDVVLATILLPGRFLKGVKIDRDLHAVSRRTTHRHDDARLVFAALSDDALRARLLTHHRRELAQQQFTRRNCFGQTQRQQLCQRRLGRSGVARARSFSSSSACARSVFAPSSRNVFNARLRCSPTFGQDLCVRAAQLEMRAPHDNDRPACRRSKRCCRSAAPAP